MGYGIALDLGTSGFRGQAIELTSGEVLATVITSRHPVPGANIMDHLNFAVDFGLDIAHDLVISAINQIIFNLGVPPEKVTRLAVCGNPIQLSIFEEIEIRDLAYAGERKKKALGVIPPNRDSKMLPADRIRGLALPTQTRVYIPPAVRHEIGADALAMMILSGLLDKPETALVTDYGTNAEMALKVGEVIYTGSCAAGPALEGQHITNGMLAAPGAIADLRAEGTGHRLFILDQNLIAKAGDLIDLARGTVLEKGPLEATGITGTGVIAVIYEGMKANLIRLPEIKISSGLHLTNGIRFSKQDLGEAGKAIGALRAGYLTLAKEAGIALAEIECAYMAGASGTYVDAFKAYRIGMVPPAVQKIYQIGNTSLALARRLIKQPELLGELQDLANKLRARHCMFGMSKDFANAYLLELSFWGEGMPWKQYWKLGRTFKLPDLPLPEGSPDIHRIVTRDIDVIGTHGLQVIEQVGNIYHTSFSGCLDCGLCISECPEKALELKESKGNQSVFSLRADRCNGTACLRCERVCPEKVFSLKKFMV
ncbi:MAG: methylamine methyltransferase corrinoid protein reductive activase [Armatimonadetes bacterium]|nr:methylamine methyltransferase corrinoid protein reductive activase [Armatimonadota bacterium]